MTLQSDLPQTINPPRQTLEAASDPAPAVAPDVLVEAVDLGKRFRIYPRSSGRLVEWLTAGAVKRHEEFWALRDVAFQVRRGECLGVIGPNGSGKSTLLKLLSGAMHPTQGTYRVEGRVLSLLELGTGLNPEMTGRQNVVQSTALLALGREYATEKMPQIEAFAELGDFFDRPVRLYSSGMLVRLVFSMFACFDPELFIVDEALSVGDIHFQQKCAGRIRQMLDRGVTMLFVSHDLAAVEALCHRVMVLQGGRRRFIGDKKEGLALYYSLVGAALTPVPAQPAVTAAGRATAKPDTAEGTAAELDRQLLASLPWRTPDTTGAAGGGQVRITGLCYRRADGVFTEVVERGAWIDLFVRYEATAAAGPINCGLALHDRLGQLLFAVGWLNGGVEPLRVAGGESWVSIYRIEVELEPGEYTLSLGAAEALPDPASPTGWNQHLGGERYVQLPQAGKIAVLRRRDGARASFGPANLRYSVTRTAAAGGEA